jgi:hypothetical protein
VHSGAGIARQVGGIIAGTLVHDDHLIDKRTDTLEAAGDALGFVAGIEALGQRHVGL